MPLVRDAAFRAERKLLADANESHRHAQGRRIRDIRSVTAEHPSVLAPMWTEPNADDVYGFRAGIRHRHREPIRCPQNPPVASRAPCWIADSCVLTKDMHPYALCLPPTTLCRYRLEFISFQRKVL